MGKLVRGAIGRKTELLQNKPSFMLIGKKRISLKKAFPVYFDNRSQVNHDAPVAVFYCSLEARSRNFALQEDDVGISDGGAAGGDKI